MARAILQNLSDGLNARALKVHRRRSKHSGQVAFGASGELISSRCIAETKGGQATTKKVSKTLHIKKQRTWNGNHPHVRKHSS